MRELKDLRAELDVIDKNMLELFEKRMDISKEVAAYKKANNMPILDLKREKQLLADKAEKTQNENYKQYVYKLFSDLMDMGKDLQSKEIGEYVLGGKNPKVNKVKDEGPVKVFYQGIMGSYGQQAAYDYFKDYDASFNNVKTFADVFKAVDEGLCDYGVVPVENSSTGLVNESYDLFESYNCYIVGEYELPVEHSLLAVKGANIEDIKEVYSHPQGLMQCQDFIEKHGFITVIDSNTAVSAARIAEGNDKSKAAIASKCNADIYGLSVLAENINHNKMNVTRFYIICNNYKVDETCNKTSIIFATKHEAGALFRVIKCIAEHDLSITMICSRPIIGSDFEYKFFLDFFGCVLNENVIDALQQIKDNCQWMNVLGCYRHR